MDTKRVNKSFMALSRSDSGLTLVNSDSLVRKNEQQQLEIETKSKKIVELEDIVYNLEDVIVKCKSFKFLHAYRNHVICVYRKCDTIRKGKTRAGKERERERERESSPDSLSEILPVESKKFTCFNGLWNKKHVTNIQAKILDCVHTMPAYFENGEKFDG